MRDQAGPATKRQRYTYTLADKNWFVDCPEHHPKVNAIDLGTAMAEHINGKHSRGQVAVTALGKSTVAEEAVTIWQEVDVPFELLGAVTVLIVVS
jgi:hypothetical protein